MNSLLKQSRIVLVEPSQPGNVGAAARAMNNMGVTRLHLVNPCDYFDQEAKKFAANSHFILDQAQVFESLEQAVSDCHLIIGTSARFRDRHKTVEKLWQLDQLIPRDQELNIAFVFGRERTGLTNEEMAVCNEWVHIPTFGESSSLNLAQAVIVVLYEFSKLTEVPLRPYSKTTPPALSKDVEGLKHHLFQVLESIGFLKPGKRATLWSSFSDLLGRAKATELDISLIRGILHKVELALKRKDQ